LATVALALGLGAAFAQHHEAAAEHGAAAHGGAAHGGGALEYWKWANFALLAGALGWVIRKNAGPFFQARSLSIRKAMAEADAIRAEAERRSAEVDARLAGLGEEIARLKTEALAEQQAENERFRAQTAAEMVKVQAQAEQEIAAAGKQARLDLKRHSASLALEAAEGKIRARMTPAAQQALIESFTRSLEPAARESSIP
jgi:F-type H+-transporting ATPase subunit b